MPSETHQFYKEHDYCVRCHKQPAPIGQAVCFDCIDVMAEGKRRAHAQGLCVDCWQVPAYPNTWYCPACQKRRNAAQRQRRQARNAQGLCVYCGQAPQWGRRKTCAYCWRQKHGI